MSTNTRRRTESTARPAPRQLATPTDLKPDDVRDASGWEVRLPEGAAETEPPSVEELRLIREDLDPQGVYSR